MPDTSSGMFRKKALDRLASPEQLDEVMSVTSARTWIALAGLVVLLIVVIIWGFVGTVPTQVRARGLLIGQGGIVNVFTMSGGVIEEIAVSEGDRVTKGQRIARIVELGNAGQTGQPGNNGQTGQSGQTAAVVTDVISPFDGRVIEITRKRGDFVAPATPLLNLQIAAERGEVLRVVAYVPADEGKNVTRAMRAQISPATAAREEYGFLEGRVTYVSEFPASREGMLRVLSNPDLVQALAGGGPSFAVYADLERDPSTTSGFKWSSPKGSGLTVASGTPCDLTITIRERRPIDLVIPLLRKAAGL
jgi:multidrug efflux pump subunit AcrA (membrane-fusion protein)